MPEYEYSDAPWRFHAAPERATWALDGWILPDGVAFDGSDPCVAYVEGVGSLDLSLILAAPELLATLELLLTDGGHLGSCLATRAYTGGCAPDCGRIRAAIATAHGEAGS